MADLSYPELNSDLGTNTADGVRNVANTAANFACAAYKNYAGATTGFPDPTGFGAIMNSFYSRLCSPRGSTPPPPAPPFTGGQCPYNYTVTLTLTRSAEPTSLPLIKLGVRGPISRLGYSGSGSGTTFGVFAAPSPVAPSGFYPMYGPGSPADLAITNVGTPTITPPSGSPDNCGNPQPQFPPLLPPIPVVSNNTTINIGGPSLTVPIAIIPVLIDANVNIKPTINVNVGPFNVTFDAGGVTVAPSFQFSNPTTVNPTPGNDPRLPPPTPTPQPQLPSAGCDLSPVISRLQTLQTKVDVIDGTTKDTKDCACPGKYQEVSNALGNGNSGSAALPAYARTVKFSIGTLEANVQSQFGGGNAPNVYYLGWYAFTDANGNGGDRRQIQYQTQTVTVPPGAKAVSWTIKGQMVAAVSCLAAVPNDSSYEPAILQFKKKPT
jgi:hypothetical protein